MVIESRSFRIIDLHEREARLFPRNELFDSQGQSLLLPETRQLSAVDIRDVADGVELRALGLIGYLPLTRTIVLNLRPKFPLENLWEMLKIADEDYDRVFPILRSYGGGASSPPHQLLIRGFCHYLRQITSLGLAKGYYREAHRGYFRPKVNFGKTISLFLSRGNEISVESDSFSFSSDLYANGLIKAACLAFIRLLPKGDAWIEERQLLLEALEALQMVTQRRMKFGDQYESASLPIWLRRSYFGALTIYAILLGFTKVGFSYEAQGTEMPSFLFSLDKIFESFIRNTFRASLRKADISVLDGNMSQHYGSLFIDNKRFPTKPDLIFRKKKNLIGIGEVKYKPRIEESDRYQVISHSVASGAPFGFWISPSLNDASALEYIGSIRSGIKFFHYRINIGGDLEIARQQMVESISAVIV